MDIVLQSGHPLSSGQDVSTIGSLVSAVRRLPHVLSVTSPLPLVAVFGLDEYSGTFSMLYADARGVSRVYSSTLVAGEWTIWGDRWTRDFAVSYAKLG